MVEVIPDVLGPGFFIGLLGVDEQRARVGLHQQAKQDPQDSGETSE